MDFKRGTEGQKTYTPDQYQSRFFPSLEEEELLEAETPYEQGVRHGKAAIEAFVEGLRKAGLVSGE